MSLESLRFTRRDLLKYAGSLTALSAVYGVSPNLINVLYLSSKEVRSPRLKEKVSFTPISLGVYPHDNRLSQTPAMGTSTIVGYFPSWQHWRIPDIQNLSESQVPMLSLAPNHGNRYQPFRSHDVIDQQAHIQRQAQQFHRLPKIYIRYGYEMNGNWFPYGRHTQAPSEFVAGWNTFVPMVKSVLPQAQFIWAPNVDAQIQSYYPAGEYEPDIIGLDGYNKHSGRWDQIRKMNPNPTFTQLFGSDIRMLQDISEKPIWITEIGAAMDSPARTLDWMTDALTTAPLFERVEAVCIFAWNKYRHRLDLTEADWGSVCGEQLAETIRQSQLYHFT